MEDVKYIGRSAFLLHQCNKHFVMAGGAKKLEVLEKVAE